MRTNQKASPSFLRASPARMLLHGCQTQGIDPLYWISISKDMFNRFHPSPCLVYTDGFRKQYGTMLAAITVEVDWRNVKKLLPPSATIGAFTGALCQFVADLSQEHINFLEPSRHRWDASPPPTARTNRLVLPSPEVPSTSEDEDGRSVTAAPRASWLNPRPTAASRSASQPIVTPSAKEVYSVSLPTGPSAHWPGDIGSLCRLASVPTARAAPGHVRAWFHPRCSLGLDTSRRKSTRPNWDTWLEVIWAYPP